VADYSSLVGYGYRPTTRQKNAIDQRISGGSSFSEAWVSVFRADKFGEATTHWRKLEDRVLRGAGNPCPLLLLGLPATIVV
ncbi:MAG TPA: hypothetical protein VFW23_16865, partial [Tepidisphaeraceae bacterium]|nr:hypothetical protein [Tepidisphaeraceae bacterium]